MRSVKFLPLFIVYIAIIFLAKSDNFWHDEIRYVNFATNLTHGYYSPPGEINLKNGPGYPFILFPFALLGIPWGLARFLNAVFLFLAVLYFYQTCRFFGKEKSALMTAYLFGLYPPFLRFLPLLITEIFSAFLVCGFVYHFFAAAKKQDVAKKHLLISGLFLGSLALTKVFFGYTIMAGILFFSALKWIVKKHQAARTFFVYATAFVVCLPYLIYTFALTGKPLYWGSVGGLSLYWMSSPHAVDLGDWNPDDRVRQVPDLAKNHLGFFEQMEGLSAIQQDGAFKKRAIENIKNHPLKFFKNWLANLGRLFFNYPYSLTQQKLDTFLYIIPNSIILSLVFFGMYPTLKNFYKIDVELFSLQFFAIISIIGFSLLSAYGRFLIPLMPAIGIWIYCVYSNFVEIRVKE